MRNGRFTKMGWGAVLLQLPVCLFAFLFIVCEEFVDFGDEEREDVCVVIL